MKISRLAQLLIAGLLLYSSHATADVVDCNDGLGTTVVFKGNQAQSWIYLVNWAKEKSYSMTKHPDIKGFYTFTKKPDPIVPNGIVHYGLSSDACQKYFDVVLSLSSTQAYIERERSRKAEKERLEQKRELLNRQLREAERAVQEQEQQNQSIQMMFNAGEEVGRSISGQTSNQESSADGPPSPSAQQNRLPQPEPRNHTSETSLSCGIKPIPKIGCRIGRCVDGSWEQVCDSNPTISCGTRPIPKIGCRVGRCIDGAWEQVCDSSPGISCGVKPIPRVGCRIGRCVDSQWEQVCE